MKSLLKKLINGHSFSQEYLCLANDLKDELRVFLTTKNKQNPLEVTSGHIFLGYKPMLIGIVLTEDQIDFAGENVCLFLTHETPHHFDAWKGFQCDVKSIARLILKKVAIKKLNKSSLTIYEGVAGEHSFIPKPNQLMNSVISKLKRKRPGNVELPGNLYDQVRIAYAVPRKISIISVKEGNLINLFPTDLHGRVSKEYYMGSLRIGGEACKQVEQVRKIVIADVDASYFQDVYELGRNHMRAFSAEENFNLSEVNSELLNFPLPITAGNYIELELAEKYDFGIHRLFLYKILNQMELKPIFKLKHIHNYYAQWRENNKLPTEYLLRKNHK